MRPSTSALCSVGHARTLLNDGALELFHLGLPSQTVTAGVGETSVYASKAAALDLASLVEEPGLWDGVQGGPNCTVTCNGGVFFAPYLVLAHKGQLCLKRLAFPCRDLSLWFCYSFYVGVVLQ